MGVHFAVIVVGGGHSGAEAALAAARSGVHTLLITLNAGKLANMPCNPSVGGIAKSHLVFELDALGGEMAKNTDRSGLQFRVLNTRRGAAVRSNRAQCDKFAYSRNMAATLRATPNLKIIEDEVVALLVKDGVCGGVATLAHGEIESDAAVITAGTFLRGTIHVGRLTSPGGGNGEPPANFLADQLRGLGLNVARLKTGTPPRIRPESIDFSAMSAQPGDENPVPFFSWAGRKMFHVEQSKGDCSTWNIFKPHFAASASGAQIPCYLTHTTAETHRIVREHLKESALYGGDIVGTGARYCPSLEDKVVKFADKDSHHVFIEPESLDPASNLFYPNGLSCSLPESVQIEMARSVPGLERAEFAAFAYAIEYDFYDPRDLFPSLESKLLKKLFLAGQVNGTTGYEEAAAQGFVAGINAVRLVRGEPPFVLSRNEAYIGVMIDDLATKGTNEPYRMFTSRAERRLLLSQNSARYRLHAHAKGIGIADGAFLAETEAFAAAMEAEIRRLDAEKIHGQTLASILSSPEKSYADIPGAQTAEPELADEIEYRVKYRGYIAHEERLAQELARQERTKIPADFDFDSLVSLRYEAREKLRRIRPDSIGMAGRIPGVNPADVAIIAVALERTRGRG